MTLTSARGKQLKPGRERDCLGALLEIARRLALSANSGPCQGVPETGVAVQAVSAIGCRCDRS